MTHQIPLREWPLGLEEDALHLSLGPADIEVRAKLTFARDHDSLDDFDAAIVDAGDGKRFALQYHLKSPAPGTTVIFQPGATAPLRDVVKLLKLRREEILWAAPHIEPLLASIFEDHKQASDPALEEVLPDAVALLMGWRNSVAALQDLHFRTASSLRRVHAIIGVTLVAVSTGVSIALLINVVRNELTSTLSLTAGVLTGFGAALTLVQTLLKFGSQADAHHNSAVRYSALTRYIDEALVAPPSDLRSLLEDVRMEWSFIQSEAPPLKTTKFAKYAGPPIAQTHRGQIVTGGSKRRFAVQTGNSQAA